jgi:hypothetical protein
MNFGLTYKGNIHVFFSDSAENYETVLFKEGVYFITELSSLILTHGFPAGPNSIKMLEKEVHMRKISWKYSKPATSYN